MLDLRRLRLLRELSLRGTLASVAEALNYSPSSVSQQLSQLEREVGVPLLRPVGRRVQLTPEAEILVARTEEILTVMERAESELAEAGETVRGTVRLAIFQTAVLALMPAALRRLRERHPGVRLEMVQHEPETALHDTWAREFDLVVAEQYPGHSAPHHPGLDRLPLISDEISLAVPGTDPDPSWATVRSLAEAADRPWVLEPAGAASRHWALQACRVAGFEPDIRYESADLQAHVSLVSSGNAVALLPGLVWAGREPGARLIPLPGRPRRTVFTAARDAGVARPAVDAVREALDAVVVALGAESEEPPERLAPLSRGE
ncbi:LysR family transcriptional regulator [Leucobacter sp. M11]|uniref:LysR family transcriptional regulator n=1 Tax=Leucobacter sp. M11 TaxID=2993565 RepID=UPI002D801C98|nr:LysR family transcriptional regulator [Leucobacter sp. M11]MEB4613536.1 LysR family transcriptional regulator [Leucobacter sp. M11]